MTTPGVYISREQKETCTVALSAGEACNYDPHAKQLLVTMKNPNPNPSPSPNPNPNPNPNPDPNPNPNPNPNQDYPRPSTATSRMSTSERASASTPLPSSTPNWWATSWCDAACP